jgi:two-component system cell cycle sensor histidine kinase PleC
VIIIYLIITIGFSTGCGVAAITTFGSGNEVTITIADQGIGMTEDQVQIAKEPFRQVDSSLSITAYGIGLGLTISRLFVELHGGELKIQSTCGEGTIVDIKIPVGRECNGK